MLINRGDIILAVPLIQAVRGSSNRLRGVIDTEKWRPLFLIPLYGKPQPYPFYRSLDAQPFADYSGAGLLYTMTRPFKDEPLSLLHEVRHQAKKARALDGLSQLTLFFG